MLVHTAENNNFLKNEALFDFNQRLAMLKTFRLRHPAKRERLVIYGLLGVLAFCCVMDLGVLRSLSAMPPTVTNPSNWSL